MTDSSMSKNLIILMHNQANRVEKGPRVLGGQLVCFNHKTMTSTNFNEAAN